MSSEPRILIVESHDALRAMLFTILRHQSVEVDTAPTVDEAIEKISRCDYAVAIVNLDMPHDSGQVFARRLREERPETTTFVIGVRDPRKADAFVDPDLFSAILNKPLEIDLVAEIVRECARVIPPPDNPLRCPPAESDVRTRMQRDPCLTN